MVSAREESEEIIKLLRESYGKGDISPTQAEEGLLSQGFERKQGRFSRGDLTAEISETRWLDEARTREPFTLLVLRGPNYTGYNYLSQPLKIN